MSISKVAQLVESAELATPARSPEEAAQLAGDPDVIIVDVREPGELEKSGTIKNAINVPRSHLEFKADPSSPMYEGKLSADKRLVLFCASGKRAVLAAKTLQEMGYTRVEHVTGGFDALKRAGAATA